MAKKKASKQVNVQEQPISNVQWVDRDKLVPNNYNPNKVAPTELRLLKRSIIEDGWTQPIVAFDDFTIIDGFHRWTISNDEDMREMFNSKVPVVFKKNVSLADRQISTIRHNRARGTHGVLEMSDIVDHLINEKGMDAEEVMSRLGMEREEVTRLMFKKGIPKSDILADEDFGDSWVPE